MSYPITLCGSDDVAGVECNFKKHLTLNDKMKMEKDGIISLTQSPFYLFMGDTIAKIKESDKIIDISEAVPVKIDGEQKLGIETDIGVMEVVVETHSEPDMSKVGFVLHYFLADIEKSYATPEELEQAVVMWYDELPAETAQDIIANLIEGMSGVWLRSHPKQEVINANKKNARKKSFY